MRNELVDEAAHETLSLNVFGGAGSVRLFFPLSSVQCPGDPVSR
jgi:hypothetical protein